MLAFATPNTKHHTPIKISPPTPSRTRCSRSPSRSRIISTRSNSQLRRLESNALIALIVTSFLFLLVITDDNDFPLSPASSRCSTSAGARIGCWTGDVTTAWVLRILWRSLHWHRWVAVSILRIRIAIVLCCRCGPSARIVLLWCWRCAG